MESILGQIRAASYGGYHYLAIMGALTLPDICTALESSDGRSTWQAYKAWWEQWAPPQYQRILTGQDMFMLRCGVVHQGTFGPADMQYERIVFTLPGMNTIYHANTRTVNGVRCLDLHAPWFVNDMIASVQKWYQAKHTDLNVQKNFPNLLQFRPNGLAPYIIGVPVIA